MPAWQPRAGVRVNIRMPAWQPRAGVRVHIRMPAWQPRAGVAYTPIRLYAFTPIRLYAYQLGELGRANGDPTELA